MLDSIYDMTLRLHLYLISCSKNATILSLCTQLCYGRHNLSLKSDLSILMYGRISLPDATSCEKGSDKTQQQRSARLSNS